MTLERYTLSCCLFQVGSDTAVVRTQLTDTCGHDSNPGKCEARGALCVNSHCACVDERHPLKLPSVHTVCWPEVRLGARCYFKVSLVLTVAKDAAAVSVLEFVDSRLLPQAGNCRELPGEESACSVDVLPSNGLRPSQLWNFPCNENSAKLCSICGGAVGTSGIFRLLAMPLRFCLPLRSLAANVGSLLVELKRLNFERSFSC